MGLKGNSHNTPIGFTLQNSNVNPMSSLRLLPWVDGAHDFHSLRLRDNLFSVKEYALDFNYMK